MAESSAVEKLERLSKLRRKQIDADADDFVRHVRERLHMHLVAHGLPDGEFKPEDLDDMYQFGKTMALHEVLCQLHGVGTAYRFLLAEHYWKEDVKEKPLRRTEGEMSVKRAPRALSPSERKSVVDEVAAREAEED